MHKLQCIHISSFLHSNFPPSILRIFKGHFSIHFPQHTQALLFIRTLFPLNSLVSTGSTLKCDANLKALFTSLSFGFPIFQPPIRTNVPVQSYPLHENSPNISIFLLFNIFFKEE